MVIKEQNIVNAIELFEFLTKDEGYEYQSAIRKVLTSFQFKELELKVLLKTLSEIIELEGNK